MSEKKSKKALLIQAGRLLYGERWQTELARELGLSDARRIRQWLSDARPIPDGISGDLGELLNARKQEIDLVLKEFITD